MLAIVAVISIHWGGWGGWLLCLPLQAGWPRWRGGGGWMPQRGGAIQLRHKTRNVDVMRESQKAWRTRGLEEEEEASQQVRGQSRTAGLLPACLPVGGYLWPQPLRLPTTFSVAPLSSKQDTYTQCDTQCAHTHTHKYTLAQLVLLHNKTTGSEAGVAVHISC